MGRGLAHLTGIAAFALVLARLSRLIETGPGVDDWQVILVASAVLGGVAWWLVTQLLVRPGIGLALFTVGGMALLLRISAPGTLIAAVVPGPETLDVLGREMSEAVQLIRHGLPPVEAMDGLIAALAVLAYLVGAAFAWSSTAEGPVSAAIVPSFVVYLQVGLFDQQPAGMEWMAAAAAVLALGAAAIALERSSDAGSTRNTANEPLPRRSTSTALANAAGVAVVALFVANIAGALVPENAPVSGNRGLMEILGGDAGRTRFDRWVDLNQQLLDPTGAVMFTASLEENDFPADSLYWRMETLGDFDGVAWGPSETSVEPYVGNTLISGRSGSYAGTVVTITQDVRIEGLATVDGTVPTAGVPIEIRADTSASNPLQPSEFGIRPDGSIAYLPGLKRDDSYRVVSQIADVGEDLGSLARGPDGIVSPLFAAAAEVGEWEEEGSSTRPAVSAPADLGRYLSLPPGLPPALGQIARERTLGATTDFERGWMLQAWFRDSGDFTYSTNVTTGHSTLDLAQWLGVPGSENYRTGYCEQFAASMAVLARTLGIESRVVWGFTPGSLEDGVIVVRDSNAHAWVELWIDGFGWVPFEPTPRADGALPPSMTEAFDTVAVAEGLEDPTPPTTQPPTLPITPPAEPWSSGLVIIALITAGAAIAVIPLIKLTRRSHRRRRLSDGEMSAAWEEIVDRLQDLGTGVSPALTPLELAERLDSRLVPVAMRYSEEVYGGRSGLGRRADLESLEIYLRETHGPVRRGIALLNPRSLTRRARR